MRDAEVFTPSAIDPARIDADQPWQFYGKCGDEDPELFFPNPSYIGKPLTSRELAAKEVCKLCPVISQCLEKAIERDDYGVWGGLAEQERRKLRLINSSNKDRASV